MSDANAEDPTPAVTSGEQDSVTRVVPADRTRQVVTWLVIFLIVLSIVVIAVSAARDEGPANEGATATHISMQSRA